MRLVNLIPLKEMYNPAEAFNKKVSKMTDNNDHTGATIELAIYMDVAIADKVNRLVQRAVAEDADTN